MKASLTHLARVPDLTNLPTGGGDQGFQWFDEGNSQKERAGRGGNRGNQNAAIP